MRCTDSMPTFVVETNLAEDAFPEGWMVEATLLIASLLKKPEKVRNQKTSFGMAPCIYMSACT